MGRGACARARGGPVARETMAASDPKAALPPDVQTALEAVDLEDLAAEVCARAHVA